MPKARIQWAPDALYNLRSNHGPTRAWVEGVASGMAAAAGEGFEWSSQQGARNPQGRWRAIVYAATRQRSRRTRRRTLSSECSGA
ncbi:hypothetical protein GS928_25345 [Rhodococcus hoagii]|nr:hypothetical protein [Prescottella equi]